MKLRNTYSSVISMLWHIGNTTVRTPYRLREALIALQNSPLNGNLSTKERESEFAHLLHEEEVVHLRRISNNEDVSDLGRKWRAALHQLGFITPKLPNLSEMAEGVEGLLGRPHEITPNGYNLINASTLASQQECFLRSLASYKIPSIIEKRLSIEPFSPLYLVLRILVELGRVGEDAHISFQEFALFVQTGSPETGIDIIIGKIIKFRKEGSSAQTRTREYDRVAREEGRQVGTLDDYADLSFRYLRATGVFSGHGRKLTLSPLKEKLAILLQNEPPSELSDKDYLHSLWAGFQLPTDEISYSISVAQDLAKKLSKYGEEIEDIPPDISYSDIESKRHDLEAKLFEVEEVNFAEGQAGKIDEILAWMEAILNNTRARLPDGSDIAIPRGERPAYLEWIIWRAFLAINNLFNKPWESRRFSVDQDFLPVHHAPSGGPDMIFEFDKIALVVEVTLSTSSRQEAAEGEPVRRHVAKHVESSSKKVYGLFIATDIDNNTAHTFRSGDWYLQNDRKINVDIVPITLSDFLALLRSRKNTLSDMSDTIHRIMLECRACANQDAPEWKQHISEIMQRFTQEADDETSSSD